MYDEYQERLVVYSPPRQANSGVTRVGVIRWGKLLKTFINHNFVGCGSKIWQAKRMVFVLSAVDCRIIWWFCRSRSWVGKVKKFNSPRHPGLSRSPPPKHPCARKPYFIRRQILACRKNIVLNNFYFKIKDGIRWTRIAHRNSEADGMKAFNCSYEGWPLTDQESMEEMKKHSERWWIFKNRRWT